jgi:hypothetical protein
MTQRLIEFVVNAVNMQAARFVTGCFVYSGAVLCASWVVNYQFQIGLASLSQLGVALAILFTGVQRLRRSDVEENNPSEYGFFAYGMAVLSLALTAIFITRIVVL